MAQITHDDVLKLAQLSRIKVSEGEIDKFVKELGEIVKYVEQIDKIDVTGLKPTDQVTGLVNVTRADEPVDYGTTPEQLLKNAPAAVDKQIKVKRIIQ